MDRRYDLAIAIVVTIMGCSLLYASNQIPLGLIKDPIGPRGMPTYLSIFMILGGMALIAKRLYRWDRQGDPLVEADGAEDESGHAASPFRAFAVMGVALGWVVLLPSVGFVLTTPLALACLMALLGIRSRYVLSIVPLAYTGLVYIVFSRFLLIRFPEGITSGLGL